MNIQITPTNNLNNYGRNQNLSLNNPDYSCRSSFNFKNNAIKLESVSAKTSRKIEYSMRVIANKLNNLFQSRSAKATIKGIASIVPRQNYEFLEQLCEISKLYATKKVIEVGEDQKVLKPLAKNGGANIFIMNHSNQVEDPLMLALLNTLLVTAYKECHREDFPLPKIIMNEDILKAMNPTMRKAYENFGAVGIDASLIDGNKGLNAKAFLPIIKDFIKDKCNVFIFPEGRLAIRNDLTLQQRFQPGVANLINKILGIKKEVSIVPVGFAYGKDLNSMNIGTPITVKRNGLETTITKGDIELDPDSKLFKFFDERKDIDDITITKGGIPVEPDKISTLIKTILCENLKINTNIAQKNLNNDNTDFKVDII